MVNGDGSFKELQEMVHHPRFKNMMKVKGFKCLKEHLSDIFSSVCKVEGGGEEARFVICMRRHCMHT